MDKRATGLLFPGYGSQYVGMGKDFYDSYRSVQELFEQAGDCTGINFVKLCFAGSESTLAKPLNAYLSLLVVQVSMYTVMREHGIKPVLVSGWGVGTISAHYAAGVLTFPDALYILKKYIAFFMQVMACHGCVVMNIKGVQRAVLEGYLAQPEMGGGVALAIVFFDHEYLVVGNAQGIARLKELLMAHNVAQVSDAQFCYGLHLLDRDGFVRVLLAYLEKIDCNAFRTTLIAQNGTVHALGTRVAKSAFLEPLLGPIEVGRAAQQLRACSLIVNMGDCRTGLAVLKQRLASSRVVLCKTVDDMKRIA